MKKVVIIGSGALKIGEAGEFDYSGTQALKALKEEGIETILINPNIATVQTSKGIADKIYFLPITTEFVEKVINKEKPNGILLSFGGQTALNCGINLFQKNFFEKNKIKILGTPIKEIISSEDRDLFCKKLNKLNIKIARSKAVSSIEEAFKASKEIGFPLIIRSAYSLGGLGSGFANNIKELKNLVEKALVNSSQILIEESLKGWKEIEYEIMCDKYGNCISVCNMENFDPIGIHTGESIVVAPSQTLNNSEYQKLRNIAIIIAKKFNIIGECNVQFALSRNSEDYRVIEMNPRLSRSSALASKATGYPIAFIAAKLSIGYGLHELKNLVNKNTSAFFEPSLDYIVCKFPRWDLDKFYGVSKIIGSSMKSIGEVMSIGVSFEESFQKGLRMLDIGLEGFFFNKKKNTILSKYKLNKKLKYPSDKRIKNLYKAFNYNYTINKIHILTGIDPWFLNKLYNIYKTEVILSEYKDFYKIDKDLLYKAKKQGFSDIQIIKILDIKSSNLDSIVKSLRLRRKQLGIIPYVRQIDTLSAEYPAESNYLYMTYNAISHDINYENDKKSVVVLGSGVYRIGSSVEFDWCCVNTLKSIREEGYRSIMINCNPETVSTDFDECDRLYFEEINLERILDILDLENPKGTILSVGGQTPNNLAKKLHDNNQVILGSSAISIDRIENRYSFSKELDYLNIDQPSWKELSTKESIYNFIKDVGYPILIRPSYVLSGSSMVVIFNKKNLDFFLNKIKNISSEYPIIISKFVENANEIEIDAVSSNGKIIYHAISEHIEFAGVHSGDATLVYPAQNINLYILKKIEYISNKISKHFEISGPFNIQFLLKENHIQVIECNLRASRSFPFISKVSNFNMINLSTKIILKNKFYKNNISNYFNLNHIGIKSPQFSFSRLKNADPVIGVDMASTGEVGALGKNFNEVIIKSMLSVGYKIPKKNILISGESLINENKMIDSIKLLVIKGYSLFTTKKNFIIFNKYKIKSIYLSCNKKSKKETKNNIFNFIKEKKFDLIINIPKKIKNFRSIKSDNNYIIRRMAIDFNIPLLTNIRLSYFFIKAFCNINYKELDAIEWKNYF